MASDDDTPFGDDPIARAARLRKRGAAGDAAPRVDLNRNPLFQVGQAVAGLARANDPPELFVQGGRLVRYRADEDGRPMVEALTRDELRIEAVRRISFERTVTRKDGGIDVKFVNPPPDLLSNVLKLGEWEGIPPLAGVVEAPVLREDGSVVSDPGYDPASGLLLHPSDGLERFRLPDPAPSAVEDAVRLLVDELLGDFPFASQADRANAIGLLLTPLIRHVVPVVPLAIISSPIKGSGKNLLASAATIVATGRPAEVYPCPVDDEEMRKAILAKLSTGASVVFLDEARELRAGALSAALTAETYQDRRLGHTEEVRVRQAATWIAAGNNVTVAGDLDRRSYAIRLDPKVARPWQRSESEFRHPDLIGWMLERRWDLLAAALTMVTAWHAAGRPAGPAPALGSFTAWAQMIGGVLHHAGIAGFLDNLAAHYDQAADEANAWEALLLTAGRRFEDEGSFLTADLARYIESDPSLVELLPDHLAAALGTRGFAQKLGKALRARVETRHGASGARLVVLRDTVRNASRWRVLTGDHGAGGEHSRRDAGSAGSADPASEPGGAPHSRRENPQFFGDPGSAPGVPGVVPPTHVRSREELYEAGAVTPGTPALPATKGGGGL